MAIAYEAVCYYRTVWLETRGPLPEGLDIALMKLEEGVDRATRRLVRMQIAAELKARRRAREEFYGEPRAACTTAAGR